MKKTLYLFVDTETTGLNYEDGNSVPRDNKMLQIAFKLYDHTITKELVAKNYYVAYTRDELHYLYNSMNDYVKNMHTSTGLLNKLGNPSLTTPVTQIDNELRWVLDKCEGYQILLAGNNVQFDYEVVRRHLPKSVAKLYHSVLDVSSIRRAFSTINSDFGQMVKENKSSNHDALIDIEECVRELRVYQRVLYSGLKS